MTVKRTIFPIICLASGGAGRFSEVAGKQQPRQQEGGAQSCVEKRDEPVRGHAAGPQPDAAGHHHRHDDEGLHIEEFEEEVQLLLAGADAGCDRMLPIHARRSRRGRSLRRAVRQGDLRHQLPADHGEDLLQLGTVLRGEAGHDAVHDL